MIQDSNLTLKGLKYRAGHGYYEAEREKGNHFEVDLVFHLDLRQAGEHDDLRQTVNYEEAESITGDVMNGQPVMLIETLAVRIGTSLIKSFPEVEKLEVRVRKLNPPLDTPTEYSEVSMTWKKS